MNFPTCYQHIEVIFNNQNAYGEILDSIINSNKKEILMLYLRY